MIRAKLFNSASLSLSLKSFWQEDLVDGRRGIDRWIARFLLAGSRRRWEVALHPRGWPRWRRERMMDETSEESPGWTGIRRFETSNESRSGCKRTAGETRPQDSHGWQRMGHSTDLLGSPPLWLKFIGSGCNLEAKLENPGQRLLS